ncbi:hypothetical protein P175DRAFT_0535688 [Aspergillus ochraceoroseus IBT 24754]|uniref:BZIP domain-containing protein n=1 Tax=Aspergillus ochraceoroseus IBT 24754 TaxID=1392256 RepID=A0A2T5LNV5_9EURO|nr:uncharacterized protein P175DRAFT_0535688 [Aspergillus ochraceoroseus IBT 24754]PTU17945.1 hypothetical protein P175DRAFT_0535688 [Aspergillus ochraceoroseus IBT 24754]
MSSGSSEQVNWDDWTQVTEPGLRKRIQNRVSQRRHRERKRLQNHLIQLELGPSTALNSHPATDIENPEQRPTTPTVSATRKSGHDATPHIPTAFKSPEDLNSHLPSRPSKKCLDWPEIDAPFFVDDLHVPKEQEALEKPDLMPQKAPGEELPPELSQNYGQEYYSIPMGCNFSEALSRPSSLLFGADIPQTNKDIAVQREQANGQYGLNYTDGLSYWQKNLRLSSHSLLESYPTTSPPALERWRTQQRQRNSNPEPEHSPSSHYTVHKSTQAIGSEKSVRIRCGCHLHRNHRQWEQLRQIIQRNPQLRQLARQPNVRINIGAPPQADDLDASSVPSRMGLLSEPRTGSWYMREIQNGRERMIVIYIDPTTSVEQT